MKYSHGDRFIIDGIRYKIESVNNGLYTMIPLDIMDESIDGNNMIIQESELPLPMYSDYYIGEMATVNIDKNLNIRIQINPDPNRIGNPYFKVYDACSYQKETKVARLHFLDTGMEYHQDEFADWVPTNKEIKRIKGILLSEHSDDGYTNWQMACWLWNLEYNYFEFGPKDMKTYFGGKFDTQYKDHPSYVPSTTPIPDTWEYNPPKGKNKRR